MEHKSVDQVVSHVVPFDSRADNGEAWTRIAFLSLSPLSEILCAWMRCLSSINLHTPGKLALHRQSLPRVDHRNHYGVRPERHGCFRYKRAQQLSKMLSRPTAAQRFVERRKRAATEAVASRESVIEALTRVWPSAAGLSTCPAAAWSIRTTRLARAYDDGGNPVRELLHAFALRQEANVGAVAKISCTVLLTCLFLHTQLRASPLSPPAS